MSTTRRWAYVFGALGAAGVLVSLWMIFFFVPTERSMGIVQRIFYVHLPSALVAYLGVAILALCSIAYLWLRDDRLDAIAVSAAELATLFLTVVLVTGPLWGKIAWGAWWVWDARLTTTLLLWLMLLGYFTLRGATDDPERGRRFGAVMAIVAAVDVPLIHLSVNWFRSQHPQPVILRPEGPRADPAIVETLLVSLLAFTLLFLALLLFRYGLERARRRGDFLRVRVAATR